MALCLSLFLFLTLNAQLHFESLIYNGMGRPLLENVSSVAVSPDGEHLYSVSYNDNAISVFARDVVAAAPGALSFIETHKNEVEGVSGLGGAFSVKVSPDGNHVYVAGSIDDAIVVFKRNVITGTLTWLAKYSNGTNGITGLDGAYAIDITPDGNHIYVTSPDENAVAVFQRNVISGELTLVQVIEDEAGGVTAMNFPLGIIVSQDGKHVYVTSFSDRALNVFSRDPLTGTLSLVEAHIDGQAGVDGLDAAYGAYISPDGNHVYVAGQDDNAISAFSRDDVTGALTYIDSYFDDTNGVNGLQGATSVIASPDGNYLYVSGSVEDAVAIFSRDAGTGVLTYISMIQEGVNGVSGISYPLEIDISNDGKNLYVTGFGSASLAVFDINIITGMLDFKASETGSGLGVSGLDGATATAISPDGNNVYVAGNNSDAIVVCSRDPLTGTIAYQQEIKDSGTTDGLNGINAIAVSPDGAHVYSTGFWDKTLVLYDRNPISGNLNYVERYKDAINGVDGLNGANWVSISPDGNNVYTTGYWEHAVSVFTRNPATGVLTFVEVHKDGVLGVDGINRASQIEISPDGKNAYVAGNTDNAIAIFNRDILDGTLTYSGLLKDGIDGVDGLERITSLAISPDGLQVYTCGFNDDAVSVFDRDPNTGDLTFVDFLKNGVDGVIGLNGPSRVVISNDGEHIYVSSSNDDAIVAIRRNVVDGTMTYESVVFDTDVNVNGLDGAQSVSVSPDGKNMYVTGATDDAVAVFSCTYILTNQETICEGDSVVVGASVYHESGIYVDTFSFGACKSVITLELTVHPLSTTVNVEICAGDTYELDGNSYTNSGIYTHELISSHGCDSTVVLNLDVVDEFETTQINAEICQGESYVLGTQSHVSTGVYTESFTTTFGCDSVVVLDLIVNPTHETSVSAEICQGDFYVFGTQNYIVSGTYVETFQTVNGCDSMVTLDLIVHGPFSTISETICEGDGYELGTETYFDAGTYVVNVPNGGGCDTEVTLNLAVEESPSEDIENEICEGDVYIFNGNELTESGIYTAVFTAANGCDSTIILDLTVNITNVNLEKSICEGDEYEFAGNVYTSAGSYIATFPSTSGCGDSTVVLNLTVEPAFADINVTICEGESYILGISTFTETGTYVENVTSAQGCITEVTLDLFVAPESNIELEETLCAGQSFMIGNEVFSQSGNYTGVLQTSEGCDSTVNLSLVVLEPIVVNETVVNNDGSSSGSINLIVTGGLSPFVFSWSNGATTQNIENLNGGTYEVVITDANGCVEILTFVVDGLDSTYDFDLPFDLTVYPNPVKAGNQISLNFASELPHQLTVQVFDAIGQLLSSKEIQLINGNSTDFIEAPVVQGLYMIHIIAEDGSGNAFEISVKN